MKTLTFSRRAKTLYAVAIVLLVASVILQIRGSFWPGVFVGITAFGLAFGTAQSNGHLTARRKS